VEFTSGEAGGPGRVIRPLDDFLGGVWPTLPCSLVPSFPAFPLCRHLTAEDERRHGADVQWLASSRPYRTRRWVWGAFPRVPSAACTADSTRGYSRGIPPGCPVAAFPFPDPCSLLFCSLLSCFLLFCSLFPDPCSLLFCSLLFCFLLFCSLFPVPCFPVSCFSVPCSLIPVPCFSVPCPS